MKSIEEIKDLDFEELERIASDDSIKAPASLGRAIDSALTAAALEEERRSASRKAYVRYAGFGVLAAAAASLAIVLAVPEQPKDTFDDPLMAYAQIEKTFSYISSKMDKGLDLATEAEAVLEKQNEIIHKINNR